tara:strand:+ start:326 stop:613 length:288 start_codon:yes stop_codon:yes gene_type:complete
MDNIKIKDMENMLIDSDYINSLSEEELIKMIKRLQNYILVEKRKNKKYVSTNKGRISTRNASKRYYYRKKCNNRYHEIYNPNGIKLPDIIEINSD